MEKKLNFKGFIGDRLKVNEKEWLLKILDTNPAITEIFHQRDLNTGLNLDSWSGEYPGKLLTGAVLCWKISKSTQLKSVIEELIKKLSEAQDEDGYLGVFPKNKRFFGKIKKFIKNDWLELMATGEPDPPLDSQVLLRKLTETPLYEMNVGDLWGHYHCMLGLWLWYQETDSKLAFKICMNAADLICRIFLNPDRKIIDTGAPEFNMAIIHIYCLMYKETQNNTYLKMVHKIEKEWKEKGAGNYLNSALEGKEFYETPKPRWESLHNIQALAELYYISGNIKYRKVFEHYYWSIVLNDRHNTGGFSSGEKATGNPYDPYGIETCATVTWLAVGIDMLYLTGNSIVADEIELSTFNAMLGAQAPSGRWWTYNTPMEGYRKSFYYDANWQSLPGGPELNCCYTNGAKGLGMLSEWSFVDSDNGFNINYYGAGNYELKSSSGQKIRLTQKTDYPINGEIKIRIDLEKSEEFTINLRIPKWSNRSMVAINDEEGKEVSSGNYHSIKKVWKNDDSISISLGMSLHRWIGHKQFSGKTSLYYGPILLAYDKYFNKKNPEDIPTIVLKKYEKIKINKRDKLSPWLLFKFYGVNGEEIILCDFASAGARGYQYWTWLPVLEQITRSFFDPSSIKNDL